MERWTVRNVELEAIRTIQEIAAKTGASLGEALSAAIYNGSEAALEMLVQRNSDYSEIVKDLELVQTLQQSLAQTLQSLCRFFPR